MRQIEGTPPDHLLYIAHIDLSEQYSGSNTTYLREVALAVSADLLCDACLSCTDLKCDSKSSPSYGDLAGNDLKK